MVWCREMSDGDEEEEDEEEEEQVSVFFSLSRRDLRRVSFSSSFL